MSDSLVFQVLYIEFQLSVCFEGLSSPGRPCNKLVVNRVQILEKQNTNRGDNSLLDSSSYKIQCNLSVKNFNEIK